MAVCHRCGRGLHPQADEIVYGGRSALYCSPCANLLHAGQRNPRMVRAILLGVLMALIGAGAGAAVLSWITSSDNGGAGLAVFIPALFIGASFLGFTIGAVLFLGSGRKGSRKLQWIGGMLTGLAMIASQFIAAWMIAVAPVLDTLRTQHFPSDKTFFVHIPTFTEQWLKYTHRVEISPIALLVLDLLTIAFAISITSRLTAPLKLMVRTPQSARLLPFRPGDGPLPVTDGHENQTTGISGLSLSGTFWSVVGICVSFLILWVGLFPVFATAREKHRGGCNSNIRQLALAIQMYAEDNGGRYPGVDSNSWASKISPYLGSSAAMFSCPQDYSGNDRGNSYAMGGLLFRPDGTGVSQSQVRSPSEVGALVDASPTVEYPQGRIVGGVPLGDFTATNAEVEFGRHSNGAIVGFCDGHAKYYQSAADPRDLANGTARALYQVSSLGLVDNPIGGVPDFTPARTSADRVVVGGEFCTSSLLMAAVKAWEVKAQAPWYTHGFKGQYATAKRPANYLWGTGDGRKPAGNAIPIARDAVVVIVAKGSKIASLPAMRNSSFEVDYASLRQLFGAGYAKDSVQVYSLGVNSGTRRFLAERLGTGGKPLQFDKNAVTVASDLEIVEKVSNDAWGIGYCSSAFADPDRVVVLALKVPEGKVFYYPQKSEKHRWVVPDSPNWPWTRTLYAEYGGAAWQADGSGIANVMLAPGGAGTEALRRGPLFGTGLWGAE